jgi:hypothetical protein
VGYIDVPIETDPVDLAEEAFAYIESERSRLAAVAREPRSVGRRGARADRKSELRTLLALVPESIFRYYGESVLALRRTRPCRARHDDMDGARQRRLHVPRARSSLSRRARRSTATRSRRDSVRRSSFGHERVAVVAMRAIEPGVAASGLSGTVQTLDQLDFVASVTLDAATSGGARRRSGRPLPRSALGHVHAAVAAPDLAARLRAARACRTRPSRVRPRSTSTTRRRRQRACRAA